MNLCVFNKYLFIKTLSCKTKLFINRKSFIICVHKWSCEFTLHWSKTFNPSRPNPGRREKTKFKYLFSYLFVVPRKVLWKVSLVALVFQRLAERPRLRYMKNTGVWYLYKYFGVWLYICMSKAILWAWGRRRNTKLIRESRIFCLIKFFSSNVHTKKYILLFF